MSSATYLLKATSEEMSAWKASAERRGQPFAEWLREAAAAHARSSPAPAEQASLDVPTEPGPRKRKAGKLDPGCRNAEYHWKVEPGNVCSFCGGSR